jgi:hypothetical protein
MHMKILIPTILGLLLVFGTSPLVFASTSLPFNGSGSGTFVATSPTTVALTGTGNYEHLGLVHLGFTSTITGTSGCGGFTAMEQDVFTAANGDKLVLSVQDIFCPTSTPGGYTFTATFLITGGSGRFADASGSGNIQGTATFTSQTTGTFAGSTSGTISY